MIYTNYFGQGFLPLVKALEKSVEENTKHTLIVKEMHHKKTPHGKQSHYDNLRKLQDWNDYFQHTKTPTIFMDADTIVRSQLDFSHEICITSRPDPCKYNAGVVYLEPTQKARLFMQRWADESERLFNNLDKTLLVQYKGLTQSALSLIIDIFPVTEYPCHIYNCAATDWPNYDPIKTKVIHIKDNLRHHCLKHQEPKDPVLLPLYKEWIKYER